MKLFRELVIFFKRKKVGSLLSIFLAAVPISCNYFDSYRNVKAELSLLSSYGEGFNYAKSCFDVENNCFEKRVSCFQRMLKELNIVLEDIQSEPKSFNQLSQALRKRFPDFKLEISRCLENKYEREQSDYFYDDFYKIQRIVSCIKFENDSYFNRFESLKSLVTFNFDRQDYQEEFEYLWLTDFRRQTFEQWISHNQK